MHVFLNTYTMEFETFFEVFSYFVTLRNVSSDIRVHHSDLPNFNQTRR